MAAGRAFSFTISRGRKLLSGQTAKSLPPRRPSLTTPTILAIRARTTATAAAAATTATNSVKRQPTNDEADSEDFWTVPASDTSFWTAYVSTRPNYSKSFYQLIYDHHSTHSSPSSSPTSWSLAHDVGCGAGQVADELATRFAHVVASDNVAAHVTVAESRLSPSFPPSRISYTCSKGEDLCRYHPAGGADLIACAEALVLMDTPAGLGSFATLLRSGGTLAAWFYGRPTFADGGLFARAQPLVDEIMWRNWAKVIRPSGQQRMWGFRRCADAMASWLDYVDFDPQVWDKVERWKWNTHGTLPFFGEEAGGWPVTPASNVKQGVEEVREVRDDGFWGNDWDVGTLKEYFRVLYPGFQDALAGGDKQIDALFRELTREMGGEEKVVKFTWPAALLLATKR